MQILRRLMKMRIGFLFNHDQIHHVAHSLPIALAIATQYPNVEIAIATTTPRIAREVVRLLGFDCPDAIKLIDLDLTSRTSRALKGVFGKIVPASRLLIYRDNLDFFRSLDALVVTERMSLILKTRYRALDTLLILSDHGAGDRAIGFGRATALFDHILAAGPKICDRLISEAGVNADQLTMTGYPKFDIAPTASMRLPIQSNNRRTVLYNPHVSPHLSSWYRHGRAILDYFLESDRYNLIFAPHIMMFERPIVFTTDKLRMAVPGRLSRKYFDAPNIHIDLGSAASTDMSYTNVADIYLGDASSQIYEFLRTPRPCVFMNTHKHDYSNDPNFAHWQAGPVIDTPELLDRALAHSLTNHEAYYAPIQQSLFDYTFNLNNKPSAIRAAHAVVDLVARKRAMVVHADGVLVPTLADRFISPPNHNLAVQGQDLINTRS